MNTIATFEIQGLPSMSNGLKRQHWRTQHNEALKWKNMVREQCVLAKITKLKLNRAVLSLVRVSSKEPDFDGLVSSFKRVIDGLVECGVIVDDKMGTIGQPNYSWEKTGQGKGKIRVTIASL